MGGARTKRLGAACPPLVESPLSQSDDLACRTVVQHLRGQQGDVPVMVVVVMSFRPVVRDSSIEQKRSERGTVVLSRGPRIRKCSKGISAKSLIH